MYAVYRAIKFICNSDIERAVIFSDSLSVLQSIESFKVKCHYMTKLQKLLATSGKQIVLEWVPAHVGIHGNTCADAAAKSATEKDDYLNTKLHFYDLRTLIKDFVLQRWQADWSVTNCPTQRLKPILGDWKSAYRENRREEIVLARLRVGYCRFLIQHHLNQGTPIDYCTICNTRNNLYHLFLICPLLNAFRLGIIAFLDENGLSHSINSILGDNFPSNLIFEFLKAINYYRKV